MSTTSRNPTIQRPFSNQTFTARPKNFISEELFHQENDFYSADEPSTSTSTNRSDHYDYQEQTNHNEQYPHNNQTDPDD
jgi:hypothetical protein